MLLFYHLVKMAKDPSGISNWLILPDGTEEIQVPP